MRKMTRFKLDASRFVAAGQLELLWQPPVQDFLDVLAERLLNAIQRLGVKCLFIDGIGGFQRTVASTDRLDLFLTALFTALRTLDVTTVCSVELPDLFSPTVTLPQTISGTTAMVENILLLRHVELHSQLYRLISIMKMRESGYDPAIREFRITDHGIEVASTFASAEAILTGIARFSTVTPGVPPAFGTSGAPSQGQQL
jgi:circadian clock protein KaiC